ncbi:MAG: hypothetical protein ACLFPD_11305 [Desulfosudaceae bacterium]
MRQKFSLTSEGKDGLVLTEYSELEKNEYSIINTATYSLTDLRRVAKQGLKELMPALRHKDFFPPSPILEKVAAAVLELMESADRDKIEVTIDDNQVFEDEEPDIEDLEEEEMELDELDDILDSDEDLSDDDDLVDDEKE